MFLLVLQISCLFFNSGALKWRQTEAECGQRWTVAPWETLRAAKQKRGPAADIGEDSGEHESRYLQGVVQLVADVHVLLVVVDLWVVSDERVLRADVDGVVNLPVDVSHLPGRMEQTLERLFRG